MLWFKESFWLLQLVGKTAVCKIQSWNKYWSKHCSFPPSLLRRNLLQNPSNTDISSPVAPAPSPQGLLGHTALASPAAGPPAVHPSLAAGHWGLDPASSANSLSTSSTAEERQWWIREGQILTDLHPCEPNCFSLHPVNHTCQWNHPATPLCAAQVCDGFGNKTQVSQVPGQHIHHLLGMAQEPYTKPFFYSCLLQELFPVNPDEVVSSRPICWEHDAAPVPSPSLPWRQSLSTALLEMHISVKQKPALHT